MAQRRLARRSSHQFATGSRGLRFDVERVVLIGWWVLDNRRREGRSYAEQDRCDGVGNGDGLNVHDSHRYREDSTVVLQS
jgi:hypothetical protein